MNYIIKLNPRSKPKLVHRDRLNVYQGPNNVPDPPIQRVTSPGSSTLTASETEDEKSLPETLPYGATQREISPSDPQNMSMEPSQNNDQTLIKTLFGRTVKVPNRFTDSSS